VSVSAIDNVHDVRCRFCGTPLELSVVDLGMSPLCESFVHASRLEAMEPFYPLHVRVCEQCWLVQLPAFVAPEEIFSDYVEMIRARLGLGGDDLVVELASNDGYLLQHFVGTGVSILGIDPAANVAVEAKERGVPTLVEFFGRATAERLASEGKRASLIVGNNVLAQVPDLHDFIGGTKILLRDAGTATFEFPHLLRLLDELQYDTIYHEHFSYFSLGTLDEILRFHHLELYDVEELWTHGGSLRVYVQHAGGPHAVSAAVRDMIALEQAEGLRAPERYRLFADAVKESKRALLELLIRLRRDGKPVCAYGAPGKGNTLLNYCGIRTDLVDFTVDRNPHKHGLFTPGTHIPILPVERIAQERPEYILVLPWNLIDEISSQLAYVGEWGGKLIVPVPLATTIEPGHRARERLTLIENTA
jgi:hypothetical protein